MWIDKDNLASAAVVKSTGYRDCTMPGRIIIVSTVAELHTLIHVSSAGDGRARHICPDSALPARSSNQDFDFKVIDPRRHATYVNNSSSCGVAKLVISRYPSKHDH